jgi:hypothetical protein
MKTGKRKAEIGKPAVELVSERFRVGEFALVRTHGGPLWLAHESGEGMVMNKETEAAFAAVVKEFFKNHF